MEEQGLTNNTGWIQIFDPAPRAGLRLVCCPHAGASAGTYRRLSAALPGGVEALSVQYPGRRGGSGGRGIDDIGALADRIGTELLAFDDLPLAVLGHSMGSVVAFEVTRRLEAAGRAPVRLFVSGRRSPSAGLGLNIPRGDDEVLDELRELGGIPARLLDRPKYRESILTVIRNDYRANSRYTARPDTTVTCPVTFLFADADPYLDLAAALGWKGHTTGEFRLTSFPGGHFFLDQQLAAVVATITADLGVGSTGRADGDRA